MTLQWNLFWADLQPVRGSEQAGTRPVLVISAEEANEALPVVAVVPLTSMRPGRKIYSIEAFLPSKATGLPRDSITMAHQVRTIAKERLREHCGSVEEEALRESVREALKIYLDLL